MVRTGPLQPALVVVQSEALPPLPSSAGLVTPSAGSMVSGVEADVPVVAIVQLPT